MIYICEDCGFLFSRVGEVKECPSCNKDRIRLATSEEAQRLQELLRPAAALIREHEHNS